MASLTLQEEQILSQEVKQFPVLYHKTVKGHKEKDVVKNAWDKVAESLDFVENSKNILYTYLLFEILCVEKNNTLLLQVFLNEPSSYVEYFYTFPHPTGTRRLINVERRCFEV